MKIVALVPVFLIFVAGPQVFAQIGCPAAVQIVAPMQGDVVSSQQFLTIQAQVIPSVGEITSNAVFVQATISSRDSEGTVTQIAKGDARSMDASDLIQGLWNLNNAASGPATITVTVQEIQRSGPCAPVTATVAVTVNRAPTLVRMDLNACQATPSGTAITLHAVTQDFENDPVVAYIWNSGDGSPPTEIDDTSGEFRHTYASSTSTVILWVTAYDSRGGMLLQSRELDTAHCAFLQVAQNQCGCDGMTVSSRAGNEAANRSNIYCDLPNAVLDQWCAFVNNPPPNTCPGRQVPFRCNLGPMTPAGPITVNDRIGWVFEVRADLNRRSNDPTMCDQGQFVRGTFTRQAMGQAVETLENGIAQRMPAAGNYQFPNNGNFNVVATTQRMPVRNPAFNAANFGADDYTAQRVLVRFRDGEIGPAGTGFRYWLDSPGVRFDPNAWVLRTEQDEFVSFVRGSLGICWCQFRVQHQWTRANGRQAIGGGAAPNAVEMVAGNNCTVP